MTPEEDEQWPLLYYVCKLHPDEHKRLDVLEDKLDLILAQLKALYKGYRHV